MTLDLFLRKDLKSATMFFRDYPMLNALRQQLQGTDRHVSIASAGCANGKELYSILIDNWDLRDQLELIGYDINAAQIQEANGGMFRLLPEELDELYGSGPFELNFPGSPFGGWDCIRMSEEAKGYANFEVFDFLASPLPRQFDVITLMHVLGYYTSEGIKRVAENIVESLVPNGILIADNNYGMQGLQTVQLKGVYVGQKV